MDCPYFQFFLFLFLNYFPLSSRYECESKIIKFGNDSIEIVMSPEKSLRSSINMDNLVSLTNQKM